MTENINQNRNKEDNNGVNKIRFIDHTDVAQFFPAYLRHKEKWNEFKDKWLTAKQFEGIIKGNVDYNWYKKCEYIDNQNSQEINNNRDTYQNQTDNCKKINIETNNKDQIINVDINTKQKTIEDAWN